MTFAYDEELLDAVSAAIAEPDEFDPEVSADIACEIALNAIDRLIELSVKDSTAPLVAANRIFVGLILQRSNTLARLLMAKDTLRFVNHA